MKTITIEVPEEIYAIIESDALIKTMVKEIAQSEIMKYVLTILALDKLAESSKLMKEDIMEIDEKIKKKIYERMKDETSC